MQTKVIIPNGIDSTEINLSYPIYPILGLVSTIVGTILAIVLMPVNPFPAGALYNSALAMTLGLALAPLYTFFCKPQSIFRAEHILILAPIYWLLLDLLQSAYSLSMVSQESLQYAWITIGLFSCGVWLASIGRSANLPQSIVNSASYTIPPNQLFGLIFIFFILGMLKYALATNFNVMEMFNYLFASRWAVPWGRGALGGWDAFLDHAAYFGYLLPTLTVQLAFRSKKFTLQVVISALMTLCVAAFLAQGGGRRIIGVVFGAALFCWLVEQKRLSFRQIFLAITCVGLLLSFMQLMVLYRGVGWNAAFSGQYVEQRYKYLHVDDNFLRLSQTIEIIPRYHSYVYEKQIIYTLVRPIPRVFWPGKPIDAGFDLTAAVGLNGLTLSTTVIGEWYMSGGLLAVLLGGWLYGKLANSVSTLLMGKEGSTRSMVYGILVMTLFAGMRSMIELISMSYALLAWIAVSRFFLGAKFDYTSSISTSKPFVR